ncbi:MAG: diacylglycerol kinase [Deltaproteobacteria bacterium]|jgi:dihydrofolate reductase|nr:diacylglycerol kinase [Deltaproteobacteria bacterium]
MRVSLVAASARNRVIGLRGEIPWCLPDDQRFFRELTTGHCIVFGRKTFDSIGHALPNRKNLVLTRGEHAPVQNIEFFGDLASAIDWARENGFDECFIAGGEAIYREAMETADRIHLTRVEAEPEGDTWFPEIDETRWQCIARDPHPADEHHAHAFVIETWERCD